MKSADRRRRSRFNPCRSKPERKGLAAVRMNQRRLFAERHEFVAQLQPAAKTPGRVGPPSRQGTADQRAFPNKEIRSLRDFEEPHAGAFGEGELEVPGLGKPDQAFADQGGSRGRAPV